jgi:uncharacterized small protein (DUF1192 family)
VTLQRDHEELEAKALAQEMTNAFLNKENTTLIAANKEMQNRIALLEMQLAKAKAFALEVLTEAERLKAERATEGNGSATAEAPDSQEQT